MELLPQEPGPCGSPKPGLALGYWLVISLSFFLFSVVQVFSNTSAI